MKHFYRFLKIIHHIFTNKNYNLTCRPVHFSDKTAIEKEYTKLENYEVYTVQFFCLAVVLKCGSPEMSMDHHFLPCLLTFRSSTADDTNNKK